ncbi:MAG: hypothetical protein COA50_16955 [Flavobacteriaceae bacterium]|nr:MAG: hypothetical protein COA50_16955 [Flavobacteriaceae bacterium]
MRNPFGYKFLLIFTLFASFAYGQGDYYDQFSSQSYSNNDGTLNFATNWVESGDGNSPTNGRIRITGNRLRFDNIDSRRISRTLDLSGASNVNLTFTYDANSRGNESLRVELWNDVTSAWDNVTTINTTNTGTIAYALTTNQITAASAIRFRGGDTNWGGGERIYIDDVRFVTAVPNTPPTIIATGNQPFCIGTSLAVAESVSITDPDDTTTNAVYIQVSAGYVNGEDLLTLTGTHPNISASWDAIQGELSLTGTALYSEYETAILAVEYSSSGTPTGTRQFSITVGEANFLPATGHYYEYVADLGITWTAANAAASARTHFGLQGYLATLTSQAEADFSGSQAPGVGWIGGSDAASEGDWRWVTGPEAGTPFWSGAIGGSVTAPYNFAFWNTNEPNQSGNEDYAHITHPNVNPNGSWNDLSNTGASSGDYQPQGYVVEYGGTGGDPVLNITATTSIIVDTVAPTASNPSAVLVYCTADIPAANINVVTDEADNCTVSPVVTHVGDSTDGGTSVETITRTYRVTDDGGNFLDVTQTITVNHGGISVQPSSQSSTAGTNTIFSISATNVDTYQWQLSTNGGVSFGDIADGAAYSGTQTAALTVISPDVDKNGYVFRVNISHSAGVSCTGITSNEITLTISVRSVVTNRRVTFRVEKS